MPISPPRGNPCCPMGFGSVPQRNSASQDIHYSSVMMADAQVLRDGDWEKPTRIGMSRAGNAELARQARIMLPAVGGLPHAEVAGNCETSLPTVRAWRARCQAGGITALGDGARPGHPQLADEIAIVNLARREHRGHASLHPIACSRLNMAEIFFGIIARQAIRRGTLTSVKDLVAKIGAVVDGWNARRRPCEWTNTADHLFVKIKQKELPVGEH